MSIRPDRRRRLMGDDQAAPASGDGPGAHQGNGAKSPDDVYQQAAFTPAAQGALTRPIHEFLPSGYVALTLVMIGGLAVVGLLVAAQLWTRDLAEPPTTAVGNLFNLAAPRNASVWFAAMTSALAGVVATYVYSLRRNRVDDYHNRYRVWLWAALACFVTSFGESTSAASAARSFGDAAAAACNLDGGVVWPALSATLVAAALVRLLIEVWRSRGSATLLAAAGLAFGIAAAVHLGWVVVLEEPVRVAVMRGAWLAGYVAVLAGFLTIARYVALEIDGTIAVKARSQKPAGKRRAKKATKAGAPSAPRDKRASAERAEMESASAQKAPTVAASTGSNKHVRRDNGSTKTKIPKGTPPEANATGNDVAEKGAAAGGSNNNSQPHGGAANNTGEPKRKLSRKERRRLRREAQRNAQS